MRGTAPANADWARRKRNVVELLHRPSYAVGLEAAHSGRSVLTEMGLDDREVASHGGAFPIVVERCRRRRRGDRVRTPATPGPRTRRRSTRRTLRCRPHGSTAVMTTSGDTTAVGSPQYRQDRPNGRHPRDPAQRPRSRRGNRITQRRGRPRRCRRARYPARIRLVRRTARRRRHRCGLQPAAEPPPRRVDHEGGRCGQARAVREAADARCRRRHDG